MEAGHEQGRDRRPAVVGAGHGPEFCGDGTPIDGRCKADQFVVHVQGQVQAHGRHQGAFVGWCLGLGVHPEILVRPTAKGVREGRDEVLDKALAFVGKD